LRRRPVSVASTRQCQTPTRIVDTDSSCADCQVAPRTPRHCDAGSNPESPRHCDEGSNPESREYWLASLRSPGRSRTLRRRPVSVAST
jgi:hypothetical protein